jgi:hypothetical protein
MFSKGGMNDSAVEKDFGSVRNAIELLQGFIELVIVVVVECCHPGLDFLFWYEHPNLKVSSHHLHSPASKTLSSCIRDGS